MRLTHLGLSSPVSIHFIFIHAWSSSFARVVPWMLIICVWGSSSSVLSFVIAVAILGAGLWLLSLGPCCRLWAPHCCLWVGFVCGQCTSFVASMGCGCHTHVGWGWPWAIDVWGGRCFVMVSLPRRPVGEMAPISGCERRGWRRAGRTYLNELNGDDMLSPSG